MTHSILSLDFYIESGGVIYGDFFTIYAYKIFNIDIESTKSKPTVQKYYFLPNVDNKCLAGHTS